MCLQVPLYNEQSNNEPKFPKTRRREQKTWIPKVLVKVPGDVISCIFLSAILICVESTQDMRKGKRGENDMWKTEEEEEEKDEEKEE